MLLRQNKTLLSVAIALSVLSSAAFAAEPEAKPLKAEMCFGCHGEDGISLSPNIPNLAGQKSEYLVKSINDFKKGARKNSLMQSVVADVSDEDAKEIADYFSNL